jgi:hypothetical protein
MTCTRWVPGGAFAIADETKHRLSACRERVAHRIEWR